MKTGQSRDQRNDPRLGLRENQGITESLLQQSPSPIIELKTCRLCHNDENDDNVMRMQHDLDPNHEGAFTPDPLIRPCRCKGSMSYVHRSCLDQWRNSGVNPLSLTHCEVCKQPFYFESGSPYVWLWVTLWELCYLAGIISVLLISSWILGNLVVAATSDTLRDIAASSNEASYTENTLKVLQSVRDAKSLEDILLLGFFFLATSSGTVGLLTLCMLAYYHMLPEHNANYDGQINHNSEVNEANIQNINSVPLPLPNPEVPEEESHHSVTSAHSQLQSALSATHISSVEHPSTPDHISLVNGQAADPLGPPIRPDGTAPIEQAQVNIENGLSSVSHWEIARFILVYIVTGLLLSIFLDPSMLFIRGVIGLAFLAIFVFALPSWLIIRRTRKKIISTFRVLDLDDPRLYCHSPPSSPSSHCVDCPIPHSYRPDGIFQSAISGSASASASKFSRPVLSCYSSMRVSVGVPGIVPTNDPRDTYYVALDGDPQ